MTHEILLYYKYVHVENPEKLKAEQIALGKELDLTGRIIVASEGINGTIEGLTENTEKYIKKMRADSRFFDIDFKKSESDGKAFPRLRVKSRPEIVTLGTGPADLANQKEFRRGAYISPDELQKWYDEQKDFVVLDMRNEHEHVIGHFENSVRLPAKHFRDIPEELKKVEDTLRKKMVVSVCTGGVRCEKATSYLLERGFENVYQLEGGMVRYLEKYPGKKFKGSLYVFDNRVAVAYDANAGHEVVGACLMCGSSSETYVNCEYPDCHAHFICCEHCQKGGIFCSSECRAIMGL